MASTVFIFEDNQLIRQGLEAILESNIYFADRRRMAMTGKK
jgi:hypothetical protein